MSHRVVTAQTSELRAARCRVRRFDGIDNFLMTVPAGLLGDLPAVRLDLNVVFVAAGGEEKGMPEAIGGLGRIFADEICRSVTAIAGRHRAVRRFEPAIELFTHDVAVGAGRGIIGKVGPTLGVGKGVQADADSNTKEDANQNAWNQIGFHLRFSDSKPKPEIRNLNPETKLSFSRHP